jgi:hypothetical protein
MQQQQAAAGCDGLCFLYAHFATRMPANTLPSACPQVSEHASWSASYYKRIIDAALAAAGAPADLVQVRPATSGLAWHAALPCPRNALPGCPAASHFVPLIPLQHSRLPLSVHLPRPALQIVTGYGEAGQALVTSPGVGKLIFVGSTQIGRKVGIFFVFVAVAVWGCVGSAQISCKVRLCGPCQSGCVWLCGVL